MGSAWRSQVSLLDPLETGETLPSQLLVVDEVIVLERVLPQPCASHLCPCGVLPWDRQAGGWWLPSLPCFCHPYLLLCALLGWAQLRGQMDTPLVPISDLASVS